MNEKIKAFDYVGHFRINPRDNMIFIMIKDLLITMPRNEVNKPLIESLESWKIGFERALFVLESDSEVDHD